MPAAPAPPSRAAAYAALASLARRAVGAGPSSSSMTRVRPLSSLSSTGGRRRLRPLPPPLPLAQGLAQQLQRRGLASSSSSSSTQHGHDEAHDAPCCGVPGCQHRQPHTHGKDGVPCWACGKPTGCCTFFCACGKIQPVVGDCSYFETFHLPRRYDIDVKALEQAFFGLQKTLHPDHYGQKSQTEQDFSRSNSTFLNGAYRTLKDPTLRAKYLLQLEGIPALDERSKTADPALLMEVMELREQIEEGGDAGALRRLMAENREAMDGVKAELARAHAGKAWERMVALTNRLQYLSKADAEARERLDQLEEEEHRQKQKQQQKQQHR